MPTDQTPSLPTPNFKTSEPAPAPAGSNTEMPDLPPDLSQDQGDGQFAADTPAGQPSGKEPTTFPGDDSDFDPTVVDFETFLSPQAPAKATPVDPNAPPAPAPAAATPPAPVAPVVAPATPQTATPPTAPATPQAPAAPAAATPAQPALDPLAALNKGVAENRGKFVEALTKHYESTFTDEDVEELQTNPKLALAKMAARLHVDALQNQLSVVSSNLPVMVATMVKAQRAQADAEDTFFKTFPQLDRAKDMPAVMSIAAAARQVNPNMDHAQFVQMVGIMACNYLGKSPTGQPVAPAPAQGQRQPAAPRGFVPAGNGAIPSRAPAPGQGNPWTEMANAFLADNNT